MGTDTGNRRVLLEVEVLDSPDGGRCFVCKSRPRPMHTVRPKDGDHGRYACFAHVSEVMTTWNDHEERQRQGGERG